MLGSAQCSIAIMARSTGIDSNEPRCLQALHPEQDAFLVQLLVQKHKSISKDRDSEMGSHMELIWKPLHKAFVEGQPCIVCSHPGPAAHSQDEEGATYN
jgi:hypothetical protein